MTDLGRLFAGPAPERPAQPIAADEFRRRLASLCLNSGMAGLPRKRRDRLILLQAVTMSMGGGGQYAEAQLNDTLRSWLAEYGPAIDVDHVSLRRALVDEGFVARDARGQTYRVTDRSGLHDLFADDVRCVDVRTCIAEARSEMLRRRERHGRARRD